MQFKETEDSKCIHQNELDKTSFQHDIVYKDFNNLIKITITDQVLSDKSFNFGKNPICDGYENELAFIVYNVFDKKISNTNKETEFNSHGVSEKKSWIDNYRNQLLKNPENEKYIRVLQTIIGV